MTAQPPILISMTGTVCLPGGRRGSSVKGHGHEHGQAIDLAIFIVALVAEMHRFPS